MSDTSSSTSRPPAREQQTDQRELNPSATSASAQSDERIDKLLAVLAQGCIRLISQGDVDLSIGGGKVVLERTKDNMRHSNNLRLDGTRHERTM